tara:strand:+ start:8582 stop:8791 length:210 start_codon:yes stop_codon:yes gene_type:complete
MLGRLQFTFNNSKGGAMAPPFAFRGFYYLDLSINSGAILIKNFREGRMLKISESIEIPLSEIEIKEVRS